MARAEALIRNCGTAGASATTAAEESEPLRNDRREVWMCMVCLLPRPCTQGRGLTVRGAVI